MVGVQHLAGQSSEYQVESPDAEIGSSEISSCSKESIELSEGSLLFFSSEKELPRILRQEILAVLRGKGCRASFSFRACRV